MLQMVRDMAKGHPAAFTIDGPRGPARVAQPGAVWLARTTGNPVVPFHIESSPHWTMHSWDQTQVPKPFATVALVIGDPLYVPRGAGEAELEASREDLQRRLESLEKRARDLLASR
jgi:lysophospholipid acyltransferase (LPLAT)-like uncharacterized protein